MSAPSETGVIVAEWTLNKREVLRVRIEKYNGFDLIDIRRWFIEGDGALHPSKKGISLQAKYLPELEAALKTATSHAVEHGMIEAAMAVKP